METKLTKSQWWLMMHRVTAFWHGFGISNAMFVPVEKTTTIYTDKNGKYVNSPKPGGQVYIAISPEFMRERLAEYIKWLESYAKSWNSETFENTTKISTEAEFLEDEKQAGRPEIYKMIKLLQNVLPAE